MMFEQMSETEFPEARLQQAGISDRFDVPLMREGVAIGVIHIRR